jgi:RPA family protein
LKKIKSKALIYFYLLELKWGTTLESKNAFKLSLSELLKGEYVKGKKEFEPNYLVLENNVKVNKVHVWGIVEEKVVSKEKSFGSLSLNDFTGSIKALVFGEKMNLFKEVSKGDSVEIIGKIKEGSNERFVLVEVVKKIGFQTEMLRRVENALTKKRLLWKEKGLKTQSNQNNLSEKELTVERKSWVNKRNGIRENA